MIKIRWGVLGTSKISKVFCEGIRASKTGELVAIGSRSRDSEANKALLENFKTICFTPNENGNDHSGMERLIHDPHVDAVYIGLPNFLHKDWIIKCIEAGKHVLCEKPFVLNTNEMVEVIKALGNSSIVCTEGLMYLYHPFARLLKSYLPEVGSIISIDAKYMYNIVSVANPHFGGAIRNLGCYPISLIRFLMDSEPIELASHSGKIGLDDNIRSANIILKFPNNTLARVYTADDEPSRKSDLNFLFKIKGTTGEIELKSNPWLAGEKNEFVIRTTSGQEKIITCLEQKPLFSHEIDAVGYEIIRRKSPDLYTGSNINPVLPIEFIRGNAAILANWEAQIRNIQSLNKKYITQ